MSSIMSEPTIVSVDGKSYELVANLKAVRAINAEFGGMLPAIQRIQNADVTAVAKVVALGSGTRMMPSEYDAFEEAVWSENDDNVRIEALSFLYLLFSGGKKPTDKEAKASEGNGKA